MKTEPQIADYYASLLKQHGPTYRAADCGSAESHYLRLRALADIRSDREPIRDTTTVLDVGCGTGDLNEFWPGRCQYLGWDLSKDVIAAARAKWKPPAQFAVNDLMWMQWDTFRVDYVFASGLFQFRDGDYVRRALAIMWKLCRRALAFNVLTATDGTPDEHAHDPLALAALCAEFAPRLVMRRDYLPNDATFYLYRERA